MPDKVVKRATPDYLRAFLDEYEIPAGREALRGFAETVTKAFEDAVTAALPKVITAIAEDYVEGDTKHLLEDVLIGPSSTVGTIEAGTSRDSARFTPHEITISYTLNELAQELVDCFQDCEAESVEHNRDVAQQWSDALQAAANQIAAKLAQR